MFASLALINAQIQRFPLSNHLKCPLSFVVLVPIALTHSLQEQEVINHTGPDTVILTLIYPIVDDFRCRYPFAVQLSKCVAVFCGVGGFQ